MKEPVSMLPQGSIFYAYCWVCGSKVDGHGTCSTCEQRRTPSYNPAAEPLPFESVKQWWKSQAVTAKRLDGLRGLDVDKWKVQNPDWELDPEKAHLATLFSYIAYTGRSYCTVCRVQIDKRNIRSVRRPFCDVHYKQQRTAKLVQQAKERKAGRAIRAKSRGRKHMTLTETEVRQLSKIPTNNKDILNYWANLPQKGKSGNVQARFVWYIINNPKFATYLRRMMSAN